MLLPAIYHLPAWLALLLLVPLAGCASPSRPQPVAAQDVTLNGLESAKASFYASIDGDRDALTRATAWFEQAHQQDPAGPAVTAYLGACRLLQAAAATWPWEKGRLSKEGIVLLDQAVAAAPEDLEIRFVRGMTSYRLPRFMGRREIAVADLAYVAERATQAAQDGRLPRPLATAALYHHGLILEESGDLASATTAWRAAAAIDPATPGGQSATLRLQGKAAP